MKLNQSIKIAFSFFALLGFFFGSPLLFGQKKSIRISTTQSIKASKEEVFDLLVHLNRYPEWSPFLLTDPEQENYVTGVDGQVGATFHWKGVKEKSEGIQRLAAIEGEEFVKMECEIYSPFKGKPVFSYKIKEENGKLELVQDFSLELGRFSYFMTRLFGVEKQMKETNRLGLLRLKELLEKETLNSK
ncbi:MAG: hypothetical protein MRZ79_15625 [Bacteroidia bacterium]|nr:hypothetical protein [Bacteroidia bacterium]